MKLKRQEQSLRRRLTLHHSTLDRLTHPELSCWLLDHMSGAELRFQHQASHTIEEVYNAAIVLNGGYHTVVDVARHRLGVVAQQVVCRTHQSLLAGQ